MRPRFALVGAGVLLADQLTKLAVVRSLREHESIEVIQGVLRITHVRNPGAAFGLFRGATAFLVLAALLGLAVFTFIIVSKPAPLVGTASAMVAGGAVGNLADRISRPWPFRGTVVDFVDLGFWPAFNVADAAITVGAGLLMIASLRDRSGDTEGDAEPSDRG